MSLGFGKKKANVSETWRWKGHRYEWNETHLMLDQLTFKYFYM